MTVKSKTHRLTLMAMFAALAYIVMLVGRIPISSVDFLKYDPKDAILAIAAFILGPMPGLAITFVVALIEMITVSTTGIIGFVMNFLSSAAFIWPAAACYKRKHTLRGAVVGLVVGVLLMTGLMLMWNYFITPYYMGYPRQAVAELLLPVFLPFNLFKGVLNAGITLLVYKPVVQALTKARMLPDKGSAAHPARRFSWQVTAIAVFAVATAALCFWFLGAK